MDKKKRNAIIQYAAVAIVGVTLYATGLQTEVIAFAQRGLLATGIINPDVEEVAQSVKKDEALENSAFAKADYNLKLRDINGKVLSLEAFKGKAIFLNLWATWYPPCIAEMPSINKLHNQTGKEVVFIMLSLDQDFEKAKAFVKRKEYRLPIYAPAVNLPAVFGSSTLPTTYVIDA